jgi:hypothetical protein
MSGEIISNGYWLIVNRYWGLTHADIWRVLSCTAVALPGTAGAGLLEILLVSNMILQHRWCGMIVVPGALNENHFTVDRRSDGYNMDCGIEM